MRRDLIFVLIAMGLTAGCSNPAIRGDGAIKTEARPVSEFSRIVVAGGYQVTWLNGPAGLSITTDQNLLPLITTVVSGDTLRIESKESLAPTKGTAIKLSSRSLGEIQLVGAVNFAATSLSGDRLKIGSTGASEVTLDGSVLILEADLTGASKLKANSLKTNSASISLVGASDAHVNVTGDLKASITGAGSLTYSGNPSSIDKKITGAGTIRQE
jgi:hypothetical protein